MVGTAESVQIEKKLYDERKAKVNLRRKRKTKIIGKIKKIRIKIIKKKTIIAKASITLRVKAKKAINISKFNQIIKEY